MENIDFLLSSVEAYAKNATDIFNMFLTVLFSSFAFSAALPLRDIGQNIEFGFIRLSSSSIVIGGALAAFYIISFISFQKSSTKAEVLLGQINLILSKNESLKVISGVFQPDTHFIPGMGMPSIGFIIGSVCGLATFLWITNVARPQPAK